MRRDEAVHALTELEDELVASRAAVQARDEAQISDSLGSFFRELRGG